jgi:hypothetical protein
MTATSLRKHSRSSLPSPTAAETRGRGKAGFPAEQPPAGNSRRPRFSRVTIGFWLGGVVLGVAGCVFGACMPYHHPVAVTVSGLWWGVYCGCLGASFGALAGLCAGPALVCPPRVPDDTDESAGGAAAPDLSPSGDFVQLNSGGSPAGRGPQQGNVST